MMTDYDPTDAGKKYATSLHYRGIPPVEIAAAAFDAGAAGATAQAEPITTAAQLDALPYGRVVIGAKSALSARPHPWIKIDSGDAWTCVHDAHRTSASILADSGPLTLLAPVSPPVPEPVLLTADDPRIKVGALVEITSTKGKREGASVTYRNFVTDTPRSAWCVDEIRDEITKGATFVLLAEAPDPDVDVLDAMEQTEGTKSDEALAHLRSLGYDVVKRAVS